MANGTYPTHTNDQLGMYRDPIHVTPGLPLEHIGKYFKNATFGVKAGEEERTYRSAPSPPRSSCCSSATESPSC